MRSVLRNQRVIKHVRRTWCVSVAIRGRWNVLTGDRYGVGWQRQTEHLPREVECIMQHSLNRTCQQTGSQWSWRRLGI